MNLVKDYKQYFTPERLAKYMVSIIPEKVITNVVDLSMGECGLLEAAKVRWNNAELFGADIDQSLIKMIKVKSPYINTFHGDSLSNKIEKWDKFNIIATGQGFDLAIANPPFNYFDQKNVLLQDAQQYLLPIEMRFLLKYIDIVRSNGYICIILPYGFLSSDSYKDFRVELLKKVRILKIVKIFEGCFEKIDAETCLVLMKKKKIDSKNIQNTICIEYLDSNYHVSNSKNADLKKSKRWDIEYQNMQEYSCLFTYNTRYIKSNFNKFISTCRRGKTITNHKDLVCNSGKRFIHTTDVKKLYIANKEQRFVNNDTHYFDDIYLHEKELVIGRVGRGCIGKVAIVHKEYPKKVFSDCLYSVCLKEVNPYYMAMFLATDIGQMQLKASAKGSCSKYITREELNSITVYVPDTEFQDYWGKQYMDILSKPGKVNKEELLNSLVKKLNEDIKKKG